MNNSIEQFENDLQRTNSYVLNNPLKYTDPSGYRSQGVYHVDIPDFVGAGKSLWEERERVWATMKSQGGGDSFSALLYGLGILHESSGGLGGQPNPSESDAPQGEGAESGGGGTDSGDDGPDGGDPEWFSKIATGYSLGVGVTIITEKLYLNHISLVNYLEEFINTYNNYATLCGRSSYAGSIGLMFWQSFGGPVGILYGGVMLIKSEQFASIAALGQSVLSEYCKDSHNSGLYVVIEEFFHYKDSVYSTYHYQFYLPDGTLYYSWWF